MDLIKTDNNCNRDLFNAALEKHVKATMKGREIKAGYPPNFKFDPLPKLAPNPCPNPAPL